MRSNRFQSYLAAGVTAFCVVAASILLFFLFFHLSGVIGFLKTLARILRPIFLGMILAFLLLPIRRHVYEWLDQMLPEKFRTSARGRQVQNGISIGLSLVLAGLVVYILLAMLIPQIYTSVVGLVNAFPDYVNSVQTWLQSFLESNPDIQNSVLAYYQSAATALENWLSSDIMPNLESLSTTVNWLRTSVLPNLTGVMSGVSAMLISALLLLKDALIAVIVSVYLLARKDIFAAQSKKIVYSIFRTDIADQIVAETRSAYRILSGFINGKLLDSLIIGIITLVCCNLFRFPYPVLIATIVGVTNIIPFFGPFIGAIPSTFLILLVSPIQSVYFVVFIVVLQQFDGNILGPRILGGSTGLASFWVLFSILLFGGLFGFAGMVLGVPVFAMLYSILRRLVAYGLAKHGLAQDTKDYLGNTPPLAKKKELG